MSRKGPVGCALKNDVLGIFPSKRAPIPVLWDKAQGTIVSNESAEIIRMLNSAFDGIGANPGDYYPEPQRAEIDEINARIYDTVNNGVYKAGFATTQDAYEEALVPLFETLDRLEERLSTRRYLMRARRPRPIGGSSPRLCVLILFMWGTSNVTFAGSRITRTYLATCVTSISSPASLRPST